MILQLFHLFHQVFRSIQCLHVALPLIQLLLQRLRLVGKGTPGLVAPFLNHSDIHCPH